MTKIDTRNRNVDYIPYITIYMVALMRVQYPKLRNIAHTIYIPWKFLLLPKVRNVIKHLTVVTQSQNITYYKESRSKTANDTNKHIRQIQTYTRPKFGLFDKYSKIFTHSIITFLSLKIPIYVVQKYPVISIMLLSPTT